MKVIINGYRYDTENATHIGKADSGGDKSNLRWFDEDLYRTPRAGRYFLAGKN
jgi:hypothetical protein